MDYSEKRDVRVSLSTMQKMYEGRNRDRIRCSTVNILEVVYPRQILDSRYKGRLLGSAVHKVGIGDLHRSRRPMIRGDRIRALCALLIIRGGEGFRLRRRKGA